MKYVENSNNFLFRGSIIDEVLGYVNLKCINYLDAAIHIDNEVHFFNYCTKTIVTNVIIIKVLQNYLKLH